MPSPQAFALAGIFRAEFRARQTWLKGKFQTKLKNSRVVGIDGMQKRIACEAINSPAARRRIRIDTKCRSTTVAADHVIPRIPGVRWVVDSKLRVVENVE